MKKLFFLLIDIYSKQNNKAKPLVIIKFEYVIIFFIINYNVYKTGDFFIINNIINRMINIWKYRLISQKATFNYEEL